MAEVNNAEKPVLGRIPVNTPEQEALRKQTSPEARTAFTIATNAQIDGSKINHAKYDKKNGWEIELIGPDGLKTTLPALSDEEAAMYFGILGKPEQTEPK